MKELYLKQHEMQQFMYGSKAMDRRINDHYFKQCCAYANRMIADMQVSEEITNDKLMMLLKWREHFTYSAAIREFLRIAVHRACLDYLRRRKRKTGWQKVLLNLILVEEYPEQEPENDAVSEALIDLFHKRVESLPPGLRIILEMYMQHLKPREIGKILGISAKTVSNKKAEAIKMLKEMKSID
jgi:RNA polymerase sigma factor (sigma-70 family)